MWPSNCSCNIESASVTKQSCQMLQYGASVCYDKKLVNILLQNAGEKNNGNTCVLNGGLLDRP